MIGELEHSPWHAGRCRLKSAECIINTAGHCKLAFIVELALTGLSCLQGQLVLPLYGKNPAALYAAALQLCTLQHCTLQHCRTVRCRTAALYAAALKHCTLQHCTLQHCCTAALYAAGLQNYTLQDCKTVYCSTEELYTAALYTAALYAAACSTLQHIVGYNAAIADIDFSIALKDTTRYAGFLLAPAEGIGLWSRLFLPSGQQKSFLWVFVLPILGNFWYSLVTSITCSSNISNFEEKSKKKFKKKSQKL